MIPELTDGVLPEGVHECTIDEIDDAFGRFCRTDRRIQLTRSLRQFLDDARKAGFVAAVIIDGSYVTAKEVPGDIDLIVAYRPDFNLAQELRPFEYNVLSKRAIRRTYRFDAFPLADGSPEYLAMVEFFSQVRPDDPDRRTQRTRKGVLRVVP